MMKAKETLDQAIEQLTQLRIEMQKQGVTDLDDKASDLNLLLCKAHDQCDLADVGVQLSIAALKKIENPIKYLRDEAEKDGCVLDGRMTIELTKDASFYQEIARKALEEIDN